MIHRRDYDAFRTLAGGVRFLLTSTASTRTEAGT